MSEQYDFTDNPTAELAYLRLLLHQKGLSYSSAERALDTYEMKRRLADEQEHLLLVDYGYDNIVTDIYNKVPLGDQWREYEGTLFNIKQLAVSRSRYHILAQAFQQRQFSDVPQEEDLYDY